MSFKLQFALSPWTQISVLFSCLHFLFLKLLSLWFLFAFVVIFFTRCLGCVIFSYFCGLFCYYDSLPVYASLCLIFMLRLSCLLPYFLLPVLFFKISFLSCLTLILHSALIVFTCVHFFSSLSLSSSVTSQSPLSVNVALFSLFLCDKASDRQLIFAYCMWFSLICSFV